VLGRLRRRTTVTNEVHSGELYVNRTLGGSFVGNKVDPSQFNPIALKLARLLPTGNTDACGRTRFTVPNNSDEIQTVMRSDYQITPSHRAFARYYAANYDRQPSYDGTNVLMATGSGCSSHDIGQLRTFSSRRKSSSPFADNSFSLAPDFGSFTSFGADSFCCFSISLLPPW
jgi:hypothetical protein